MAGSISQVDFTSDGTSPEFFVQLRFPTGESPSGTIFFYDSKSANEAVLTPSETIFAGSQTTPVASAGGFDYYTYPTSFDFQQGNQQNFGITYVDENGTVQSTLLYGKGDADFSFSGGGPLGDQTAQEVINGGTVAGGAFQSGEGPFVVTPDGSVSQGGADPNAPCFLAGTLIATPHGERAIETLRAGDELLTADGGRTRVVWVGRREVVAAFTMPEFLAPVRIRAGALAENRPHTDLFVTADHGVLIAGVMANAGALVNGTTVMRAETDAILSRYTVFHLETERHDLILANGVAAESYIDASTRAMFDNYAEFAALGLPERPLEELRYPRAMSRRQLPITVFALLAERAAAGDENEAEIIAFAA